MADGASLVAWAKTKLGIKYVWGGTSDRGYDCSGFTQAAYKSQGISIPRTAQEQYYSASERVSKENLKIGDLVFFKNTANNGRYITHVGIYVGGGNFIHAPKTGDVIKISSLNDSYYTKHFAGGGRYNGMSSVSDIGISSIGTDTNSSLLPYSSGTVSSVLSSLTSFIFVLLLCIMAVWLFLQAFDIKFF